jgi:hypothetical protein
MNINILQELEIFEIGLGLPIMNCISASVVKSFSSIYFHNMRQHIPKDNFGDFFINNPSNNLISIGLTNTIESSVVSLAELTTGLPSIVKKELTGVNWDLIHERHIISHPFTFNWTDAKTHKFYTEEKHLKTIKSPYAINIYNVTNEAIIKNGGTPKRTSINLINGSYHTLIAILQLSLTPDFFSQIHQTHFSYDIFENFSKNYIKTLTQPE